MSPLVPQLERRQHLKFTSLVGLTPLSTSLHWDMLTITSKMLGQTLWSTLGVRSIWKLGRQEGI